MSRKRALSFLIALCCLAGLWWVAPQALARQAHRAYLPAVLKLWRPLLTIQLGDPNVEQGLALDSGGDVDTELVWVGTPATLARRTGNGTVLPAADGNQDADYYMQFRVQDSALFAGMPTGRVRIELEYFDQGRDSFLIEYDAARGGPYGDGTFKSSVTVHKTDTRCFRTVAVVLCDAYFANRDNGADFRLSDNADGAEVIRRVTVSLLKGGLATINVDACGASPWDSAPDSQAIQLCIDRACDGDTVTFTSGVGQPGYQGYNIDRTLFLVAKGPRSHLTFTSTDASDHALLKATADLKGFVVRLAARTLVPELAAVDHITLTHLTVDGGLSVRRCFGSDGVEDGIGDNWGCWLPAECGAPGDAWCRAGGVAMDGDVRFDGGDGTSGLWVQDLHITNVECGTALAMGASDSTIRDVVVENAGDHVHASGCTQTDADEPKGGWCDGLTLNGPNLTITNNRISNASDVGIVFFGGTNTLISGNYITATAGDHGMFAGIAIHPWISGDVSGVRVVGNRVVNLGDSRCGGIHAGINIGTHMWGGGCVGESSDLAVGNALSCLANPQPPAGALCLGGQPCQVWAYVAAGNRLAVRNNYVEGAHINYLVGGVDVQGQLVESGNTSVTPRQTDWQAARDGCTMGGEFDRWDPTDRIARDPTLAGWTDRRVHCER